MKVIDQQAATESLLPFVSYLRCGEGIHPTIIWRKISGAPPRGSLKFRDRLALFWVRADFFGFFGALKKGGLFLGGRQKSRKGGGGGMKPSIAGGRSNSFTPRPLWERDPG